MLKINKLCTPALFYLIISIISIIITLFITIGDRSIYCLGKINCDMSYISIVIIIKIIFMLLWTWILNLICKAGYSSISWFLVLLPFIIIILFIFVVFYDVLMFNNTVPKMNTNNSNPTIYMNNHVPTNKPNPTMYMNKPNQINKPNIMM